VQSESIAAHYEQRNYSIAIREIMNLADKVNQYIDEKKPWVLIKEANTAESVHDICSTGINLFYQLMIFLKPILPVMAKEVETFLNVPSLQWQSSQQALLDHPINTFKPLMQRVAKEDIESLLNAPIS